LVLAVIFFDLLRRSPALLPVFGVALAVQLGGCSLMSASGPSARAVNRAPKQMLATADIKIIDVTDAVARNVIASTHVASFVETLGEGAPVGSIIGRGDTLEVVIWEAPPAALFGSVGGLGELGLSSSQIARGTAMPPQIVDNDGRISIPFAGSIPAAGRKPEQVASDITARLRGKAHEPQVLVRVADNVTRNVTVVGDVAGSARVPLTSKGERLLDVLAAVGGAKQPVNKTLIQISRGTQMASMPLETVIRDPRQNIRMQPDDIVTALFQPYSFTALGATGRNEEVSFEGTGVTLSQALGRVAGLQDLRADVKGAFIFRLEDPAALDPAIRAGAHTTPEGKVPVVYRIDMKNPSTFFIAQSFPIRNKDVLYVSNAPLADFQKFISVISSALLPIATTAAVLP
jgi:polysaccharide export outer membrane protein